MSTAIAVSDCVYTPFFCEENAYKLCERLCKHSSQVYVVFVSNPSRQVSKSCLHHTRPNLVQVSNPFTLSLYWQVPFWRQRFILDPEGFALWDYHVFVLQQTEQGCSVWDLDT